MAYTERCECDHWIDDHDNGCAYWDCSCKIKRTPPPKVTVADLIETLQALPSDIEVKVEGCDCIGDAGGAENQGNWVLITRA